MKLGEAYIEVKTNQAKFGKELKTMESSVKRSVDRMKKNFDRIGRGVSEISGVARWGFLGMTAAIAGVTYAAQKQEKAVAKLVQQLKNHGEASQENINALTGLASALQKTTQFGDEQIIAGQAMLASFSLTTQQIKDLTPHMLNLAIMTENTTGQQADLAAVAKMVGVALGGQAGRLVQMGIKLTEAQKATLALAEEDEKINILMQIFEENAGGLAEATGKTLAGSLSKCKNAMGDLAEELGFLLSPAIVNACTAIVDKMSEWKKAIKELTPEQKKLIAQVVFLGTAALGAIGALGLFSTVARVVNAAGSIIAGTIGLITSPLGLIMVAVGALALAWAYNWGDIQGKTKAAWEFLKPIFQGIWDWLSDIGKEMEDTTDIIGKETKKQSSFWENVGKIFKVIGLAFLEIFKEMGAIAKEILKAMGFDWDKFVEGLKSDIENIKYWFGILKGWTIVKFKWTLEKVGEGWKWLTETLMPWLWTWSETTFYWLLNLAGTVWDKFKEIMQWVKEHAAFYFNWALIKIGETWDWLANKLWPWIKEWGVKAFEWGLKLVGDIWNWLKDTLIPWVKEWKEKTFEWTLNLLGDAWEKIKELLEWLKIIPEEMKGITEAAEKTGEAIKKIVPVEIIKDLKHLESIIKGQKVALEYASKGWGTYNQVAKRQIAATAASFILFEHKITDIAAKAPLEFSEKFQKGFMRAEPKIQKAILDALISGDFKRALSLAGVKAGKAFLGESPGMLTELESGRKDMAKTLDKMLGSMDAMTKKITKIFKPIIGLFKTIFDAILKIIEKFSPEAAAEIRVLVDDVIAMVEGLFDTIEGEADDLPDKIKPGLGKAKSLWQKFCEVVGDMFIDLSEEMVSAISDFARTVLTTTTSARKAFQNLGQMIVNSIVGYAITQITTALTTRLVSAFNIASEAMKAFTSVVAAGIVGLIAYIASLVLSLAGVGEAIEKIQSAWGEFFVTWQIGTREMGEYLKDLANRFAEVGLAISNTVEAAQRKLEGLYESMESLDKSTREKLIDELDKYYDYRVLREMSLDELLALSAETRTRIATEGIDAVRQAEESAAEKTAREQDSAINRLMTLEERYKTEQDLIRQKILLTKIEIKLLEIQMYKGLKYTAQRIKAMRELNDLLDEYDEKYGDTGDTVEETEERKRREIKETSQTTKEITERISQYWSGTLGGITAASERVWGRAGILPTALNEAINAMIEKMGELPTKIDFDVVGILHMPDIPFISARYFDIFGRYRAPSIPTAQVGIPNIPRPMIVKVHPQEAILTAPQAEEWREGRGGTEKAQRNYTWKVEIKSLVPPDDPVFWRGLVREHIKQALDEEEDRRIS